MTVYKLPTTVEWWRPLREVFIQVCGSQCVQRRCAGTVHQLSKKEQVLVVGQSGWCVVHVTGCRHVSLTVTCRSDARLINFIEPWDKLRQGEHQGAKAHEEHSQAQIPGLAPDTSKVADRNEEEDRGNVIATGDSARYGRAEIVAALDVRDGHIDKPIHHHALQI